MSLNSCQPRPSQRRPANIAPHDGCPNHGGKYPVALDGCNQKCALALVLVIPKLVKVLLVWKPSPFMVVFVPWLRHSMNEEELCRRSCQAVPGGKLKLANHRCYHAVAPTQTEKRRQTLGATMHSWAVVVFSMALPMSLQKQITPSIHLSCNRILRFEGI